MAINYTTKYESKIAERFKLGSLTASATSNEYSFVGAKTIKVYSVDVAPCVVENVRPREIVAVRGLPPEKERARFSLAVLIVQHAYPHK